MFNLVAPAGSPIPIKYVFKSLFQQTNSGSEESNLETKIRKRYDVSYCYLLNSGRAALYLILQAMKQAASDEKYEVIIPAYTCFSVPSAIAKAGLKARLIDIDPQTLDYDYSQIEKIEYKNVLAILASNLFGIISKMERLQNLVKENGCYLIDDAAQSMGSKYKSKYSGTFGEAGIFSLGRGKNITAYEGGVLIINSEKPAKTINKMIENLTKPSFGHGMTAFCKLLFYSLFLHPKLYWIPDKIPFLHLGETVFDPDFNVSELSGIQKNMSSMMFEELPRLNDIRKENALTIAHALIENGNYMIPGYDKNDCPAYIRLPVLCPNKDRRENAIEELKKLGINSTAMYPSSINQIPGIDKFLSGDRDDYPGARCVADCLLTLPTHPFLKKAHIKKIISVLTKLK